MPRVLLAVIGSALALSSGCIAGVVPPTRTDVATSVIAGPDQVSSGLRVSTGVHFASATLRRDVPFDFGAGYVFERVDATPGPSGSVDFAAGDDPHTPQHDDAHGGYLEAARTIQRGEGHRTWLGVRGELLGRDGPDGRRPEVGAYARLSWELYTSGEGSSAFSDGSAGGIGFHRGSGGIGVFVESGAQWVEDESAAFVATAGLSLRLPMFGGFVFDLCPRC